MEWAIFLGVGTWLLLGPGIGGTPLGAAGYGLVVGAGATAGAGLARNRERDAIGVQDRGGWLATSLAVRRGVLPADESLREPAGRLARRRLAQAKRSARFVVAIVVLAAIFASSGGHNTRALRWGLFLGLMGVYGIWASRRQSIAARAVIAALDEESPPPLSLH